MISRMSEDYQKWLASAEQFIEKGDYRQARSMVKKLPSLNSLSAEDKAKVTRILGIIGVDPVVVVALGFTLGVMVLLIILYLL